MFAIKATIFLVFVTSVEMKRPKPLNLINICETTGIRMLESNSQTEKIIQAALNSNTFQQTAFQIPFSFDDELSYSTNPMNGTYKDLLFTPIVPWSFRDVRIRDIASGIKFLSFRASVPLIRGLGTFFYNGTTQRESQQIYTYDVTGLDQTVTLTLREQSEPNIYRIIAVDTQGPAHSSILRMSGVEIGTSSLQSRRPTPVTDWITGTTDPIMMGIVDAFCNLHQMTLNFNDLIGVLPDICRDNDNVFFPWSKDGGSN